MDSSEQKIEKLVAEFLDSILAGSKSNEVRSKIIGENLDLQPELEERLRFAESIFRISGQKQKYIAKESTESASATIATFSPAEGVVRLDCPHCGHRLKLVHTDLHEVTCASCGSIVTLDEGSQTTKPFQRIPAQIGRFKILSLLGAGGFGNAYLAHDPTLDRDVAVKVPRAGEFVSRREKERFIREAKNAASLRHDNIVRVHEINTEGEYPYIVSEFIDGMTLADRISGLPIPHKEIVRLMILISEAVHFAHEHSIIHRDLKPSNIFLDSAQTPYVADFGLARNLSGEHTMTMEGEVLGTPAYMSPEQATGKISQVTVQSDVYSLGVILYRLLCRENPFRGSGRMMMHQVVYEDPIAPRKIDDRIPIDLETITLKAMDKKPECRYATAKALAEDLRRWQNDQAILARPESNVSKLKRWCRKNPRVAGLLTMVWGLLAIVSALSISWALREQWLTNLTEIQRTIADANARESQQRLTDADVQNGLRQLELGVFSKAVLWFSKALDDSVDSPAVQRLRIGMTLKDHPRLTMLKSAESSIYKLRFSQSGNFVLVGTQSAGVLKMSADTHSEKSLTMQHNNIVVDVCSDSNEERILSFQKDSSSAILRSFASTAIIAELLHEAPVTAIDFSADGQLIATGDRLGNIKVWEAKSGELKLEFQHLEKKPVQLQFLDSDRLLANSTSPDTTELSKVGCWRVSQQSSELLYDFEANIAHIGADTKSQFLLVAGLTGTLNIRELETGKTTDVTLDHASRLQAAYVIAKRREIVTLQHDGAITVWTLDGKRKNTFRHQVGVIHSSIDVNQRFLAVAGTDGLVAVYWLHSLQLVGTKLAADEYVSQVAFHPDGRRLAASGRPGTVRIFDLAGLAPDVPLLRHGGPVNIARLSADGERVITASDDHTASIWNARTGSRVGEPILHGDRVADCTFDRHGNLAASGSLDGSIKITHGSSANQVGKTINLSAAVVQLQFSPTDDALLLAACSDGTVASVDTPNSLLNYSSNRTNANINDLQFSPNGEQFIVAAVDKSASIRDSRDGKLLSPPLLHLDPVTRCGYAPDGSFAWSCSMDRTLRFWKSTSPFAMREQKFNAWPTAVAYDANGDYVVSTNGGSVTFWSRDNLVWEFENGAYRFRYCQIDSKNRIVLVCGTSAAADSRLQGAGVVFLLDLQSGFAVSPPLEHFAGVERAFFDLAGSKILSSSSDHSARLWSIVEDDRSAEEIRNHALVLSGFEISKSSQVIAVDPARLAALYTSAYEKSPRYFSCNQDEINRWEDYVSWVIDRFAPNE